MFSQLCTPYFTNPRQYGTSPKRGGAHDNAHIPSLQLHPSVAVATCRKTFFPQFVLLQYKATGFFSRCRFGDRKEIETAWRNLRDRSPLMWSQVTIFWETVGGIWETVLVPQNTLKKTLQGKTISCLSEFRVSLQNIRVSFWHPKTA